MCSQKLHYFDIHNHCFTVRVTNWFDTRISILIVCCENPYWTCNPQNSLSLGSCRPLTGEKGPQTHGKAVESAGGFRFTVTLWLEHMLRFGQHRNSSQRAAAGVAGDLHRHETIKKSKVVAIPNCQVHPSPLILDWNKESSQWLTPKTQFSNKQICTEVLVLGAAR